MKKKCPSFLYRLAGWGLSRYLPIKILGSDLICVRTVIFDVFHVSIILLSSSLGKFQAHSGIVHVCWMNRRQMATRSSRSAVRIPETVASYLQDIVAQFLGLTMIFPSQLKPYVYSLLLTHVYMDTDVCQGMSCVDCTESSKSIWKSPCLGISLVSPFLPSEWGLLLPIN